MNRRFAHLYSKTSRSVFVLLAVLVVVASSLHAQKKKQGGPRAIAVITWNGESPKPVPHASVLTPIAILVEGRYYDANLYEAQPEPLAVDSGVVYDVLQNGDPIGTFTVGGARERDDLWYGTGLFEAKGSMTVQMAKSGAQTTRTGDTASKTSSSSEDDRPKLRRGTPPPPAPKEQTDAVLKNIDRDPERPTLRRHAAGDTKSEQASSNAPKEQFVLPETHMLAAVSDAGGAEPHSFAAHYKTGELTQIREDMEKLVRSELAKQRKQPTVEPTKNSHSPRPRPATQPSSPDVELNNPSFGVFDVNTNNAPVVVYSAATTLDRTKKYITVAAWEEIDQSLRRVFTQITDDAHLDVYPRLQIVDAVDASGKGRGELLFRAFGDRGNRFVLYHPGPDGLSLLFDSEKAESSR